MEWHHKHKWHQCGTFSPRAMKENPGHSKTILPTLPRPPSNPSIWVEAFGHTVAHSGVSSEFPQEDFPQAMVANGTSARPSKRCVTLLKSQKIREHVEFEETWKGILKSFDLNDYALWQITCLDLVRFFRRFWHVLADVYDNIQLWNLPSRSRCRSRLDHITSNFGSEFENL